MALFSPCLSIEQVEEGNDLAPKCDPGVTTDAQCIPSIS